MRSFYYTATTLLGAAISRWNAGFQGRSWHFVDEGIGGSINFARAGMANLEKLHSRFVGALLRHAQIAAFVNFGKYSRFSSSGLSSESF